VQQQFLNNEKEVLKLLKNTYTQSQKDVEKKIAKLEFDINGLQQEYDWAADEDKAGIQSKIQAKIYQKQYQEALHGQIDTILDNLHTKAYKGVDDYLKHSYEDGFIGTMYDLHGQGIPLIMPIDQQAVTRAVQLDSKISKNLYTKMGENVQDLKKNIAAEVSRGIVNGSSYEEVAQQIKLKMTGTYNTNGGAMARAMTIARTEGHRVQGRAALDALYAAKDMGADVLKQWDSALDNRTRPTHRVVDSEIRELDKPFSNGLQYPGDSSGGAAEVVNCRCALTQRGRGFLDQEELQIQMDRAAFYGLDKTQSFEEFKAKYIDAAKPKKEYLTKKKLEQKVAEIAAAQQLLVSGTDEWQKLEDEKAVYQEKLDKKIDAAEIKKLTKEQILLQDKIDGYQIDTYNGIWKDDVTTKEWEAKKDAIPKKKAYFEQQLQNATDQADIDKWTALLASLDDFDKKGKAYADLQSDMRKVHSQLINLQKKSGKIKVTDAYTQERKDNALWFTNNNGGAKAADAAYRSKSGEVWKNASKDEKDAAYEYTQSYHKFNEPLRGIEYGTNKYLGVGNVDLDSIGINYGGYKKGEVKAQIDNLTKIIDKSSYDEDLWLQRGCRLQGMDKFFGIDINDFYLPEAELAAKLLDTEPIEHAFLSTGVAKGKGLNTSGGIVLNIYAPKGTKMMYVEPFSAFGNGSGRSWDGISPQSTIGSEAEMLVQRGTKFRVKKVEKSGGTIYIDVDVIEQGV
jgi:hypothetical protein